MTCRQLGGPCDLQHHGATADEVIKAQDAHLKEAERSGDAVHQSAREAMKGRWRHPRQSLSWYRDVQRAFDQLPTGEPA
jgi:hypothetical protein